jgi:hypothetical protein
MVGKFLFIFLAFDLLRLGIQLRSHLIDIIVICLVKVQELVLTLIQPVSPSNCQMNNPYLKNHHETVFLTTI